MRKLKSYFLTMPKRKRLLQILAPVLAFLPAVVLLVLILALGVNVPFWDEWGLTVRHIVNDDLSSLRFDRYWSLFNEHRIFLPQIVGTMINTVTNLNMKTMMLINFGLAGSIVLLSYRVYRLGAESENTPLMLIACSWLVFTLTKWPGWVDTRELHSYLAILPFFGAVWTLLATPPGWKTLTIAALMTYISSFSFFHGNTLWIVIAGVMWVTGYRRIRHYAVWLILALSVWIPYLVDFFQLQADSPTMSISRIALMPLFFAIFLGGPLVAGWSTIPQIMAAVFGVLGFGTILLNGIEIIRYYENGLSKATPWLALAGWVMLGAAFAAIGRTGEFNIGAALSKRYVTLSSLFWVSVFTLIGIVLFEPRKVAVPHSRMRLFAAGSAIMMMLGLLFADFVIVSRGHLMLHGKELEAGRECLHYWEVAPDDCLKKLHPRPNDLRVLMPELIARETAFLDTSRLRSGEIFTTLAFGDAHQSQMSSLAITNDEQRIIHLQEQGTIIWQVTLPKSELIVLKSGLIAGSGRILADNQPIFDGSAPTDLEQALLVTDLSAYAGRSFILSIESRGELESDWLEPVIWQISE